MESLDDKVIQGIPKWELGEHNEETFRKYLSLRDVVAIDPKLIKEAFQKAELNSADGIPEVLYL